jgi:hypothetical protein
MPPWTTIRRATIVPARRPKFQQDTHDMRFLLAVTLAAVTATGAALAQQARWAAVDANREASSPVAWGNSESQAKERAVEACEKVSKTCANGPGATNDTGDVFAYMCCTRPKLGCAVAPGDSPDEAAALVRKTLTDAGYGNCALRHHLSAGNGKKQ